MPNWIELLHLKPKNPETKRAAKPSIVDTLERYPVELHVPAKENYDRITALSDYSRRYPTVSKITDKARTFGLGSAPYNYPREVPVLGELSANVVVHDWEIMQVLAGKVDRPQAVTLVSAVAGPMNGQAEDPLYKAAKREALPMFSRSEQQYGEAFRGITARAIENWGITSETGEVQTQELGQLMIGLFHEYTELLLAGPDLDNPFHQRAKEIYETLTPVLLPYLKDFESQSSMLVKLMAMENSGSIKYIIASHAITLALRLKNRFQPIFADKNKAFNKAIQGGLHTLHQEILASTSDLNQRTEIYSTLGHFGILLAGIEKQTQDMRVLQQRTAKDYEDASKKIIGMLVAAEGTTRFAANSMITLLGQHSNVFQKLRTLRLSGDKAAYNTYADNVILETLRFVPPVPARLLELKEAFEVEPGIVLPAKTGIIFNLTDMLHDPRLYSNPDSFYPERLAVGEDGQPAEGKKPINAAFMQVPGYEQPCLGVGIAKIQMRDILDGVVDNFSQINLQNESEIIHNTNLTSTLVEKDTREPSRIEFVR